MISYFAYVAATLLMSAETDSPTEKIQGHWKGIEMFQDKSSYDGKTFYLPNSEELVVTSNKLHVYYYPYFKSDEFDATFTPKSIIYSLGRKKVRSEYSFQGDTLILSMNFISKTFIKLYKRVNLDPETLSELDEYGFNPSSLTHEFELDTLHPELRRGYKQFSELAFEVYSHLQFVGDDQIRINRQAAIPFARGYQIVRFRGSVQEEVFRVYHVNGTQQFTLIPTSQCSCDSIHIPYMVVSWADRMRKKIEDDRN